MTKKGRSLRYIVEPWERRCPADAPTPVQRKPETKAVKIYDIIQDYYREHGRGISTRELNERAGLSSGQCPHNALVALEDAGLLVYEEYERHTMRYFPFYRDRI